ncbi:MAG: tRNA pseudouridine(55) synthase TruB [Victivallales bacterium]|nr:tRNA pseudouridine(55) synthase TruB [Victivallales bacterium]
MPRMEPNHIDGLLLVDKTPDWTSHDVVNLVRRRFNLDKTGHCGTLDPLATGLLVLLLGKATKFQDMLMGQEKVYEAVMCLGTETDTEDRSGEIVATHDWSMVTEESIRKVGESFLGEQFQVPPMMSAIKKNGQPLYKMARRGESIEREPRPITIYGLDITRLELPNVFFTLRCSKGTYVRTVCADWGRKLGCGGHMKELRRVRSGKLSVDGAVKPEAIKEWQLADLASNVMSLEKLADLYGA